ncbi:MULTISPECIES: ATP-binding protein [unclassified Streptomyces]|uniref:ATP-binding protein n=1 Tax=unclassified Streptomyces TaxID=2593676 RepID=UPI003400409D
MNAHPSSDTVWLSDVVHLPGNLLCTPRDARTHVLRVLEDYADASAQAVGATLELITSELVTNAITHTPHRGITLITTLATTEVTVTVIDYAGTYRPLTPHQATPDEERGRGLYLVDALASHWDHSPTHGGGTTVRAAITLPAP